MKYDPNVVSKEAPTNSALYILSYNTLFTLHCAFYTARWQQCTKHYLVNIENCVTKHYSLQAEHCTQYTQYTQYTQCTQYTQYTQFTQYTQYTQCTVVKPSRQVTKTGLH